MDLERRRAPRTAADILVNKFIDGWPHVARLVELSASGCLLERVHEPSVERELYPLELSLPTSLGGTRMWLWARTVRREGSRVACHFVGLDEIDRATLERLATSLS